jgi:hypothetical protein
MSFLRRLRGPAISDDEIMAVLSFYHLDPQPRRALAAFERLVESGVADPARADQMASSAWVFGRIAGRSPELQGPIRRALDRRQATETPFGKLVLQTAEAGEAAGQRLLTQPLDSAHCIAFLGAEAAVTGSLDPFVRMIDAFDAPDLFRLKLERWLWDESRFRTGAPVASGIEILATDYHIIVRADPPAVLTVSDCDLMVMIRKPISLTVFEHGTQMTATVDRRPVAPRRPLPVSLNPADSEPLRIKSSAAIGLAEGLNEHEGLPDHVRSELLRRDDPRVRIDLLELLAARALTSFRFAEGIELLDRVLEIDPHRCDLVTLVARLRRDPLEFLNLPSPEAT